ncbi:MAG: cytochrome b N-terminal domain-containing protein, partial [Planctomycetaceae bacterium]|nr:cytochrome b N-terminal domain-containing protein [Planctomycetaceae bacterium]
MKPLIDWIDHRAGVRDLVRAALYEHIPGGARWRYVWGSTLVFAFTVQAITGIFLWMAYSPSTQTAWESVFYIQYEMQGGWLLRGLHHFMAQAMIVLLVLHLMQVVIDGAYKAPREVNFWLGLILMQIVLGLSLTGYLLPWDQKGFSATKVATNIMALAPGAGPMVQRLVVGGADYGHHTLTRFFALHAGVLPGLLIFFLVLHVALFRRHGIHVAKRGPKSDATFWPDQVLKDAVACLAVLAVVLFLILRHGLAGGHGDQLPGEYLGAELGAPADVARSYAAARPEWYFLFLFQFLKYFPGEKEVIGAIVIPGVVMGLLFLMPFLGRWKLGHGFNVLFLLVVMLGAGALTVQALSQDAQDESFQAAVADAEVRAARARQLALTATRIPPAGAVTLLRDDPLLAGADLFKTHCASCHAYADAEGQGLAAEKTATAANLAGFASRDWIAGLLDPAQVDG